MPDVEHGSLEDMSLQHLNKPSIELEALLRMLRYKQGLSELMEEYECLHAAFITPIYGSPFPHHQYLAGSLLCCQYQCFAPRGRLEVFGIMRISNEIYVEMNNDSPDKGSQAFCVQSVLHHQNELPFRRL